MIFDTYAKEHAKLLDDFKVCFCQFPLRYLIYFCLGQAALGRISFTSDCWSDPNLASYMAVTVHFSARDLNGRLEIRNRLLAFRIIEGRHDGKNLGQILFEIIKEAGILGQVCGLYIVRNRQLTIFLIFSSSANSHLTTLQIVIQLSKNWSGF